MRRRRFPDVRLFILLLGLAYWLAQCASPSLGAAPEPAPTFRDVLDQALEGCK